MILSDKQKSKILNDLTIKSSHAYSSDDMSEYNQYQATILHLKENAPLTPQDVSLIEDHYSHTELFEDPGEKSEVTVKDGTEESGEPQQRSVLDKIKGAFNYRKKQPKAAIWH